MFTLLSQPIVPHGVVSLSELGYSFNECSLSVGEVTSCDVFSPPPAVLLSLAVLGGCTDDAIVTEPQVQADPAAPTQALESQRPDSIENAYIVVFRDDVADPATVSADLVEALGGSRFYVYEHALKGFAVANLSDPALAALRANPVIRYVEEDRLQMPADTQDVSVHAGHWGLDRVDERARQLDGVYEYFEAGDGTHVYIVDSGVRGGHQEFDGRIGNGAAFIKWSWDPSPTIDALGHGTAVASIAAGTTTGIAKLATVHPVRIDDGDAGAHSSDIVAGLDWVAANAVQPASANLSYEASATSIKDAMEGVVDADVVLTKSAGNGDTDACSADVGTTAAGALVVSATTEFDSRWFLANYGSCVDLFAHGASVRVADAQGDNTYDDDFSGTSFAAPFAAGLAAVIRGDPDYGHLAPAEVNSAITSSATAGVVSNEAGAPDLLIHTMYEVPLFASIIGPSAVWEDETHTWTADVAGGTDPYTYEWYRDGQLVSTLGSYTGTAGSSDFDLELDVEDADGEVASDFLHVTVTTCPPPQLEC